jgi:hypothetical protein
MPKRVFIDDLPKSDARHVRRVLKTFVDSQPFAKRGMNPERALAVVERLFERGYFMLVKDDAGEVSVSMCVPSMAPQLQSELAMDEQ